MAMVVAHINPDVLRWALARSGSSEADIAQAFKKDPAVVAQWLVGEAAPTFKQAQKLAKQLRVPFGYLFLDEPPADEVPLPDFRRHPASGKPSADLRDIIFDVLRKQDWYRDYRSEREEEPLPFVGRFDASANAREVASDIRASIAFEERVRSETQPSGFLRTFVAQVESVGILVMRNGVVRHATNRPLRVDEFRGFSVADPMAPVIFINNADSNAAQVFTLAHEVGHIWIGQGGISDADLTLSMEGSRDIEEFCNQVAAELLLPWAQVADRWRQRVETMDAWITKVAREFHVSTVMVARQLWQHRAIGREQFFEFYEKEKANWRARETGSSGGNFYTTMPVRNSRRLTLSVLESVEASETSIREASRLLGVKPAKLARLEESMGLA